MKRLLSACLLTILLAAALAAASLLTYNFTFAGNGASNTGSITFDMALLTNPGRNVFDTQRRPGLHHRRASLWDEHSGARHRPFRHRQRRLRRQRTLHVQRL